VILGVVAQRLVRLNCPSCAALSEVRPLYLDCLGIPRSESGRLRHSRGCNDCGFSGSRGRAGLFELLEMTARIQELCVEGNDNSIRRAALDGGMIGLKQQAASLAMNGAISIHEAYRFGYSGAE
jgi:type II secretory ATPase GspE/PulE/Tfp pilus assembly ATPase PilB-like protein